MRSLSDKYETKQKEQEQFLTELHQIIHDPRTHVIDAYVTKDLRCDYMMDMKYVSQVNRNIVHDSIVYNITMYSPFPSDTGWGK